MMGEHHCLIVDKVHDCIFPLLEKKGIEVSYRPELGRNEILAVISAYEGIIIRSKTVVDREFLEHATNLKWVARAGAGLDQLDVNALEERGISIINAPEGNRDALAEHTIGLILSLLNKFRKADLQIRDKVWDRESNRGFELGNMTVGIIGYGFMGKAVSQKLKSFGCRVIGHDKYLKHYSDEFIQEESMDTLFRDCDLLSLHIPLTEETRKLVDVNYIGSFSKSIFLINTARGEIVDIESLNEALESGKIKGAGLDVLENEKIQSWDEEEKRKMERLMLFDNVVLTPHVGGWSYESYERISQVLANKIAHVVKI